MTIPGFTADATLHRSREERHGFVNSKIAGIISSGIVPQGLSPRQMFPDLCKIFPELCASCTPCNSLGLQFCCEPGSYEVCVYVDNFILCDTKSNCYTRRCA